MKTHYFCSCTSFSLPLSHYMLGNVVREPVSTAYHQCMMVNTVSQAGCFLQNIKRYKDIKNNMQYITQVSDISLYLTQHIHTEAFQKM